ncbi:hypothetical protein FN846DRAFT_973889 [Sphaerosporella brunnea]|uniref:DUF1754-domain-containing protein n=1 Tax=Sphaerosporella brunnea TaxID=1250544 RepID=A0A5J5EGR7_9PEZI|nr:hypothetical protein FN846DRAFT_973889 [Sphaerosporella brunnea]
MGKEDYASAGGALKLKGVASGGIKKKKKKSSKLKSSSSSVEPESKKKDPDVPDDRKAEDEEGDPWAGKTEAERRFEQRRQEQLEKRLAKGGIKSHKERVEEYNKYLASLSEHHDMPRIGPG